MTHLLDTNICSAHMRRPGGLAHRFFQHEGGLAVPTIVLAELYAGAYKHPSPGRLLALIADLLREVTVLDFDRRCAEEFGRVQGGLLRRGISPPETDLMIASVALANDLTLVTHNTADFRDVPGLRLDDWLAP
jgi:tRNA(fMet)-specific endonuclease VapC